MLSKLLILFLLFISLLGCAINRQVDSPSISILALGDSYTIGESVSENERWPAQLKDALTEQGISISELKIIAKTGWRTDDLCNAVVSANLTDQYDIVTLLIGVNDQFQRKDKDQYPSTFTNNLTQAKEYLKMNGKLVVISIPDYAYTPYGQSVDYNKISTELDYYNDINKAIAKKLGAKYVYITDITRQGLVDTDLVASDGLHPSGKAYARFVPRIIKALGL